MRRRTITRAEYERYVNAFLQEGPKWSRIAEVLGVAYTSAKLAWEVGWVEYAEWARPIKEVYAEHNKTAVDAASVDRVGPPEENPAPATNKPAPILAQQVQVMSKAEIRLMLDSAIAKVQADVAEALLREQQAVEIARNNVAGLLLSVDKLIAFIRPMVDAMMQRLQLMALDTQVDPEKVLALIARIAKINKMAIEQADTVLSMQRLLAGQPQSITESRTTPTTPQQESAKSDRERLENMLADVERRRARMALPEVQVGEASSDDTETGSAST